MQKHTNITTIKESTSNTGAIQKSDSLFETQMIAFETRNKAEALLRTVQRGTASCKIMSSK